jgi:hypothetical protein
MKAAGDPRPFLKLRYGASLLVAVVAGCATPYRPLQAGTGFTDSQVSADQFRVSFKGNGYTTWEQANDFARLRAAQVALDHGFNFFAITDVTNTSSVRSYQARQQYHANYPLPMELPPPVMGGSDPNRGSYLVEYDQTKVYYRPGEILLITCFRFKPDKPFTYDAAELARSLSVKYQLREFQH